MNASIQKFDIASTLQEKLDELTQVRGMSRDEAVRLMTDAIHEWRESNGLTDRGAPAARGTKMKAYVNVRTHHISSEPERAPAKDECQFDDVTAAAIYVSDLRRPLLKRMIEGKLGE